MRVELTPTYSGCPAIDAMRDDVRTALQGAGYRDVDVRMVLSPAWTTDWMTADGKRKLHEYGIAPPNGHAPARRASAVTLRMAVKCPRCDSLDTREVARFGSTSAARRSTSAAACLEPFDFFKVL